LRHPRKRQRIKPRNYSMTEDTTSVTRFIEDNWNLGRLGDQSFNALAGPLTGLFDFTNPPCAGRQLLLDPYAGTVVSSK
jgi:phospholipase C